MALKAWVLGAASGGLVMYGVSALMNASRPADAATEALCRQNLRCWAEKHIAAANKQCSPSLEKTLSSNWRWTNGSKPKFYRFRWDVEERGIVAYLGDRIEVQDQSGAFRERAYVCDFDPISHSVESIGILDSRPW
jgi:hypothetical protein